MQLHYLFLLLMAATTAQVMAQDPLEELEEAFEQELQETLEEMNEEDDNEEIEDEDDDLMNYINDPCGEMLCNAGRECVIDREGKASCKCVMECDEEMDDRRKVCSNQNETWPSDCALHRMRCLCEEKDESCLQPHMKHIHIDYYGHCQQINSNCDEEEKEDFPRRMREWLFNVMRDMAARGTLPLKYVKLEKEVEQEQRQDRKWLKAALWKFCDLDEKPQDRFVSRHELFPLRAPLIALEHCIAPFLDSCDPDDDHQITLKEWTSCLQLTQEHIEDLEGICEKFNDL